MKRIWFRKAFWQSVLSAFIFGVFVFFSLATIGGAQQKKDIGNGLFELAKYYTDGKCDVTTGPIDSYGRWNGRITIIHQDEGGIEIVREEVNMINGERDGISKITNAHGVYEYCYKMGKRVECEKSAIILTSENSAFSFLNYKYPWFIYNLNAFDFNDGYIEAFMDTLEFVLNTYEFEDADFYSYYSDAIEALRETSYDSIINIISEMANFNGIELLKNSEFRLATIDRYRSDNGSTFDIVKSTYPNYLRLLNTADVNEADFEGFCFEFDSIMNSYGVLDKNNPMFVDSIDGRMYRAILTIAEIEEKSAIIYQSLKSNRLSKDNFGLMGYWNLISPILNQMELSSDPKDVSQIVLSFILLKYIEGDVIKSALWDAFSLKKGIINIPVVTTEFSNPNSTSVTIIGFVIEDGGADITSRGIAWGTVHNPDLGNQTISAGTGTGGFETAINGLVKGETYYARAFATNSAGTAYGNCVSFIAGNTVGIEDAEINELDFKIYPNPASAETNFIFRLESSESMLLTIINLKGQILIQKDLGALARGENKIRLDLSGLNDGIYNATLTKNGIKKATCKFLIAR